MKWLRKEKIRKGQQERIGIRTSTYRNRKMRRITGCCGGGVERRRKGKE